MPVEARLNTIESAWSMERLSASVLETSGDSAPERTTTPTPTRPRLTRSEASLPAPANSSSAAGGAITTSKASPPATRFLISGAVLKVILSSLPDCLVNAAAAARIPGSTAPALRTLISAAMVALAKTHSRPAATFLISISRMSPQVTTTSLGAGAGVLHDFRPFRNLARDVVGEVLRRARGELGSQRFQALAQIARAKRLQNVRVEARDQGRRRGARDHDAVPGDGFEPGQAGFRHGRQIGDAARAPRSGHRERPQASGLDVRDRGGGSREHHLRLPRDDVGQRRLGSLVRHVD